MHIQTKLLILLTTMCIVDVVIPVPILGVTLIYILLQRPPWFMDTVHKIYSP
jgi:hypothetical protein